MAFLLVIISCVFGGEWTETGSTGFPLFDVGVNSGILQYSTELYSEGSWIVSTNDLGSTWDVLLRQNDGFMDIAVSSFNDKYAVVNSLLGRVLYTKDSGNTWDTSVDPVFGVQGFSRTRDNSMIYGGAGGDKVHLSYDYGRRWNSTVIGNLTFGARYIAMPSKDVWYVTAGLWIEDERYNKDEWLHFTSKIYINKHNGNVQVCLIYIFNPESTFLVIISFNINPYSLGTVKIKAKEGGYSLRIKCGLQYIKLKMQGIHGSSYIFPKIYSILMALIVVISIHVMQWLKVIQNLVQMIQVHEYL